MAAQLVLVGSFILVLIVLASILGAVDARERVVFVLGIAAFIAVHMLPDAPETAGMVIALVGLVVAVAATVPLLRQSV